MFQSPYGGRGRSDGRDCQARLFDEEFQSPYGGRGRSDEYGDIDEDGYIVFQSPYGGRGRSDTLRKFIEICANYIAFQSPYGGRGRSDLYQPPCPSARAVCFNHLTVAGVGQTGVHKQ